MFPIRRRLDPCPGSSIRRLPRSGFASAPACWRMRGAMPWRWQPTRWATITGPWAAGPTRLGGSRSAGVWQRSGAHPWLNVMDDTHHFVFLIDQVPMRFYRGLAHDPTVRTLRRQEG